jgi:F-type H+-transporting ATPase subunit alpha
VGVIREVDDGVANIEGLTDAMLNEMIGRGQGISGLALNLQETEAGVIIFTRNSRRGRGPYHWLSTDSLRHGKATQPR